MTAAPVRTLTVQRKEGSMGTGGRAELADRAGDLKARDERNSPAEVARRKKMSSRPDRGMASFDAHLPGYWLQVGKVSLLQVLGTASR
jgi:hypothetical protein